jgi:DNA-binding response OmpR family regulator
LKRYRLDGRPRGDIRGWLRMMKILIVDDEVYVAELLAESVVLQGHDAIVALSGEEGLTLMRQERPDGVFLDLVMPGISGIEVLRRIREADPTLPVIVITIHASCAQIAEARRVGATDVVEKSLIFRHLNDALRSFDAQKS